MVSKTVYGARDQEILYYRQSFFYHIVSMVVKIELENGCENSQSSEYECSCQ